MTNISENTLLNSTILDVTLTGIEQINKFRKNWVNLNWRDTKSGKDPGVYFIFDISDVSLQAPLYIGSASGDTRTVRKRVGQNNVLDQNSDGSGATFRNKYIKINMTSKPWDFKKDFIVMYVPYDECKADILKDEHLAIGLFKPPYND